MSGGHDKGHSLFQPLEKPTAKSWPCSQRWLLSCRLQLQQGVFAAPARVLPPAHTFPLTHVCTPTHMHTQSFACALAPSRMPHLLLPTKPHPPLLLRPTFPEAPRLLVETLPTIPNTNTHAHHGRNCDFGENAPGSNSRSAAFS